LNRVEALALAIAKEYQALEPNSEACQKLNPGLLRFADDVEHNGEDRVRKFTSFQGGYRALVDDLTLKCSGRVREGKDKLSPKLYPRSPLADLCETFHFINVNNILEFLRDALKDRAITPRTPISFFLQDKS